MLVMLVAGAAYATDSGGGAPLREAQRATTTTATGSVEPETLQADPLAAMSRAMGVLEVVRYVEYDTIRRIVEFVAWSEEQERLAAEAAARQTQQQMQQSVQSWSAPSSTGACASGGGYDAVPGYIVQRESHGDYCVWNGGGSGAYGKYQIMPGTWAGADCEGTFGDATPAQQDACAEELKRRSGLAPWGG